MSSHASAPRSPRPTSPRSSTECEADMSTKAMRAAPTEVLLSTAAEVVRKETENSRALDSNMEAQVPIFSIEELSLGKVLGRGGFCVVREIEKIKVDTLDGGSSHSARSRKSAKSGKSGNSGGKSKGSFFKRMVKKQPSTRDKNVFSGGAAHDNADGAKAKHHDTRSVCESEIMTSYNQDEGGQLFDMRFSRDFVVSQAKSSSRKGAKYVLKKVQTDIDKITFFKGTVDIALEAKYLASLDHPNVIQLVGTSDCGPFEPGFFLILPKLKETLTKRLTTWMSLDRQCKGITGVFTGSKKKMDQLHCERLEASYDIAQGLGYLHAKSIIFRDIKPDNIGFDGNDMLKIFDFGLAKELKIQDRRKDGLYHLTGFTGSVRYMAPEVGLGKPYNLSADVYSWSMLMWFILALEPPFGEYTNEMIIDRVFRRGSRPTIFTAWPDTIASTMKSAWQEDLFSRPTFRDISLVLKKELMEADGMAAGSSSASVISGISGDSQAS